jgi:hypothetical protein
MTEDFDSLMESGTAEAISRAYELLIETESHGENRLAPVPLHFSSEPVDVSIDWNGLEHTALSPTPRQKVEAIVGSLDRIVTFPVAILSVMIVFSWLTFADIWSQDRLYSDTI